MDGLRDEIDAFLADAGTTSKPRKRAALTNDDIPRIVDDELSRLGWAPNARLSMLGNIGRENGWNVSTVFGTHADPKNAEINRGIISWQKDRRRKLERALGNDFTPTEDNLRKMVRFMDDEIRSSAEWRGIGDRIRDPNISTREASRLFRKYIKYVPTAPYNSPDDEFDTRNNRQWADRALKMGLGKGAGKSLAAEIDAFLETQPAASSLKTEIDEFLKATEAPDGKMTLPAPTDEPAKSAAGTVKFDKQGNVLALGYDALDTQVPEMALPPSAIQTTPQPQQSDEPGAFSANSYNAARRRLAGLEKPYREYLAKNALPDAPDSEASFYDSLNAADRPSATEDDYRAYFADQKLADSPENRRRFDELLAAADRDNYGQVAVSARIQTPGTVQQPGTQPEQPAGIEIQAPEQVTPPPALAAIDDRPQVLDLYYDGPDKDIDAFKEFVRNQSTEAVRRRVPGATPEDIEMARRVAGIDWGGVKSDNVRRGEKVTIEQKSDFLRAVAYFTQQRKAIEARIARGENELDAYLQEGRITPEQYTTYQYEQQQDRERETEAQQKFLEQNRKSAMSAEFLSGVSQARFGALDSQVGNPQYKTEGDRAALDEMLRDYGSAQNYFKERERIEKEYKYRYMAGPSEFVLNVGRYITKLPATLIQAAVIGGTELNPWLWGKNYEIKAADTGLFKWAEEFKQRVDSSKNRDLKLQGGVESFVVNEFADAFGQFLAQTVLVPFTGGASLLIPLAEAGVGQYEEAVKFGAGKWDRILATTIGMAAAVPDAILQARYLRALSPAKFTQFLAKTSDKMFGTLSATMAEAQARALTQRSLSAFAKAAAANGLLGFGTEFVQEYSEDVINGITAKLRYNPQRTWTDIFVPTKERAKGYLAAGLIGAMGGNVGLAVGTLSTPELKRSDEVLGSLLQRNLIEQEQAEIVARAVAAEMRRRNVDISSQGTVAELSKRAVESAVQRRLKATEPVGLRPERTPQRPVTDADILTPAVPPERGTVRIVDEARADGTGQGETIVARRPDEEFGKRREVAENPDGTIDLVTQQNIPISDALSEPTAPERPGDVVSPGGTVAPETETVRRPTPTARGFEFAPRTVPAETVAIGLPAPSAVRETIPGVRDVATRMVNAERSFLNTVQEQFGFTPEQAQTIFDRYQRDKIVKIDPIGGNFTLTDGRFWDAEIMREAVAQAEAGTVDAQSRTARTAVPAFPEQEPPPVPEGFVDARPVAVVGEDGGKRTVRFLDERGGTRTVWPGRIKRNLPPVAMASSPRTEIGRKAVRSALKKTVRTSLRKLGYEYVVDGSAHVRLKARPGNVPEADAVQEMARAIAEIEGNRIATRSGRPRGGNETTQTLIVFVQRSGGIRPDGYDAARKRGMSGELRYLTVKEGGMPGVVNRNARLNAEQMAESAFEAGYFPEYANLAEFQRAVPPNEFLDILRNEPRRLSVHNVAYQATEFADYESELDREQSFISDDRVYPILSAGDFSPKNVKLLEEVSIQYGLDQTTYDAIVATFRRQPEAAGIGSAGQTASAQNSAGAPSAAKAEEEGKRDRLETEFGDAFEGDLAELDLSFDFGDNVAGPDTSFDVGQDVEESTPADTNSARIEEMRSRQEQQAGFLRETGLSDQTPSAVPAAAIEPINDFGEKIGGARKDTSAPTGLGKPRTSDTVPAWMKGFTIGQQSDGTFRPIEYVEKRGRNLIRWEAPQSYATAEEAMSAIKARALTNRFLVVRDQTSKAWMVQRRVAPGKYETLRKGFDDDAAAMKWIAANADELLNYKPRFPDRPHLEKVERTGPERRQGDVTPESFQNEFGFRGGEFGNWIPQDERQRILNMAYDALSDLADILGLPPRALSLGGRLAIAFGARGKGGGFGGTSAAAHYEPARAVFNLTRLHGAGSAAHEWFHALDHYFGFQNQGRSLQTNEEGRVADFTDRDGASYMLSQRRNYRFKGPVDRSRTELREAFVNLIDTIYRQPKIVEVSLSRYENKLESARKNIDAYLTRLRQNLGQERRYGRKKRAATPQQIKAFDDLADRITNLDLGEDTTIQRPKASKWTPPLVVPKVFAKLDELHKDVTGYSALLGTDRDINRLAGYAREAVSAVANLEKYRQNNTEERSTPTKFVYDAKDLDSMRVSSYWSTEHEMAARAFEAYVEDKLDERGAKSQYLVHSTANAAYEMTLFEMLAGYSPYPEGAERKRINEAFDKLFETIETVEDDAGNVTLKSIFSPQTFFRPLVADADNIFRTALERELKARTNLDAALSMAAPPPVLQALGLNPAINVALPLSIPDKAMRDRHDIRFDTIAALPGLLADPVMIFDSETQSGSLVVVINAFDRKRRPVNVIVRPEHNDGVGRLTHSIRSVYGRNDKTVFERWIERGLLRYVNLKKVPAWSVTQGLQLPTRVIESKRDTSKIYDERTIVNAPAIRRLRRELDETSDPATMLEIENLQYADFDTLLGERASIEIVGDHVKLSPASHELIRRAMEQADIAAGRKTRGSQGEDAFAGQFVADAVPQIVETLRKGAAEARRNGYSDAEIAVFARHADVMEQAAALPSNKGTVVMYVLDEALPHELFHRADYLGAMEKSLLSRHVPEYAARLDRHVVTEALWKNHFSRYNTYTGKGREFRLAILRAEIPPFLLERTDAELAALGITPEMRDEYLLTWFEGYAAKNGIESLDNFEQEELDVQTFVDRIRQAEAFRENGETRQRDEKGARSESEPQGETRAGPGTRPQGAEQRRRLPAGVSGTEQAGVDDNRKYASLPATLRAAGIETDDLLYEVFGDAAARESAYGKLSAMGVDGAIVYLQNVNKLEDADDAILSFMVQRVLLDRAAELDSTDKPAAAAIRAKQQELAFLHANKAIAAGRFTRAASIVSQSVEGIMFAFDRLMAEKLDGQTLSPEERLKYEDLARASEEAVAKIAVLRKEKAALQRKIKHLEDAKAGRTRNIVTRKTLVKKIKDGKQARIDAIRQKLRERFGASGSLKSVLDLGNRSEWDSAAYDRQLEGIELQRNKAGKILAVNGRVSRIQNERLARMIRSDEFKQWFGDWETEAAMAMPAATIASSSFPPILAKTKDLVDWALETLPKSVAHPILGPIDISKSGIKSTLSHGYGKDKVNALAAIPALLEKGIIVSRGKRADAGQFQGDGYILARRIVLGNTEFLGFAIVRRDSNATRFYVHEVVQLERLRTLSSTEAATPLVRVPGTIRRIARHLLEDNRVSEIVDDNGEPKIVYHGSPASDIRSFRVPAYFTDTSDFAEMFAGEIGPLYAAFLNLRSPLIIDGNVNGRHFEWDRADLRRMRKEGHDGVVVVAEDSSDIYTIFEPSQAKSVFNRGSFSSDDPQILKSVLPAPLDEQTVAEFAEVGAMLLTEGLARETAYLPEDFKADMESEFGPVFGEDFTEIHRRALNLRDTWIAEVRQEAKREKNPDLSDEEIAEIEARERDEQRGRRAAESLHRLATAPEKQNPLNDYIEQIADGRAGDLARAVAAGRTRTQAGAELEEWLTAIETVRAAKELRKTDRAQKLEGNAIVARLADTRRAIREANKAARAESAAEIKKLTASLSAVNRLLDRLAKGKPEDAALREIIGDLAPNEQVASAAVMLAAGADPADVGKSLGIETQKAFRDLMRTATSLIEQAKQERRIRANELANKLLAAKGELRDIEDLRFKARMEWKRAQDHIASEMRRIGQNKWEYGVRKVVDVSHAFRTMMASVDLSGALRQGGFFAMASPELQRKAFANMFKAFNEKGYGRIVHDIESNPLFVEAQRMGIDFAMAGRLDTDYAHGEELFRGEETIESIPLIGKVLGTFVTRPSERTYTAFLDTQRMVMYAAFAGELRAAGLNPTRHKREFEAIAKFINIGTGRGWMPSSKLGRFVVDLPLFAPRYTLSRFQLLNITLNPVAYTHLPPHARKIVARKAVRFYGTTMGVMALASAFGVVNWDPDDDDFLKIRIGNTKYDIFAGTLQPGKAIIKMVHSAIRTRGNLDNRLPLEFPTDVAEITGRYIRGKLSPLASLGADWFWDADYVGNKFSWTRAIATRLIPLTFSEMYQAYTSEQGWGMVKTLPAIVGIGVGNYPPRPERPETEAEKLAAKSLRWRFTPKGGRTDVERKQQELASVMIARARRQEPEIVEQAARFLAQDAITETQFDAIWGARNDTLLESQARRLSLDEIRQVYRVATPTERALLDPFYDEKLENAQRKGDLTDAALVEQAEFRNLTPDELREQMFEARKRVAKRRRDARREAKRKKRIRAEAEEKED